MPTEANSNEICARAGCFHQLGSHNIFYEGGGCQECSCESFLPTRDTLPQVAEGLAVQHIPIGGGPNDVCADCGHHAMNHANYQGVPRACNQTGCPCRCYVPTAPKADPERVPDERLRSWETPTRFGPGDFDDLQKLARELLRRREQDSAQGQGFEEWLHAPDERDFVLLAMSDEERKKHWPAIEDRMRGAWHARDAEVAGLRERLERAEEGNDQPGTARYYAEVAARRGELADGYLSQLRTAEASLKEMREKTIRKCADVAFAYEQDGDDMKRPYCLRDSILALLAPAAEPHQPHEEGQGVR